MNDEEEKFEKTPKIQLKNMHESDWRGCIALLIILGGFVTFVLCIALGKPEMGAAITPLMALVAQWYFQAKKEKDDSNAKEQ